MNKRSVVMMTPPFVPKNDGSLWIIFIGVGSAFAATKNQTNFLIIKGDKHIMVDFGMTGPTALQSTLGLKPTDIWRRSCRARFEYSLRILDLSDMALP